MVEIHFGPMCGYWSKDMETNGYFALKQLEYLRERLKYQGYLYLNDVYESLGVVWSPDNENVCFRSEEEFKPVLEMHESEIVIKIPVINF